PAVAKVRSPPQWGCMPMRSSRGCPVRIHSCVSAPSRAFARRFRALVVMAGLAGLATTPVLASPASFLAELWPQAQARGVSRAVFDAALSGFTPSERVMGLTQSQPEFAQTVGEYVNRRVT